MHARGFFSVVVTYDHDCAECFKTNPHATSIVDEVVAGFRSQNVPTHMLFAWCISLRPYLTRSSCDGAWPIWDPVQIYCVLQVQEGVADRAER